MWDSRAESLVLEFFHKSAHEKRGSLQNFSCDSSENLAKILVLKASLLFAEISTKYFRVNPNEDKTSASSMLLPICTIETQTRCNINILKFTFICYLFIQIWIHYIFHINLKAANDTILIVLFFVWLFLYRTGTPYKASLITSSDPIFWRLLWIISYYRFYTG